MPGYNRNPDSWFTDRLSRSMSDVGGLQKQTTEYIVNENRECVGIVGSLATAPTVAGGSEETGLTGWGIALKVGGLWVSLAASAPIVTSLPTSPTDGMEVTYLADATNGVTWRLRYRAASGSPHKWEFVGGSDLYSNAGQVSKVSVEAFQAQVPNPACAIALPFTGVYDVTATLWLLNNGSTMNFEPVLANVAAPTVTIIGMASAVTLPGAGAEYATLDPFVRVELGAIAITPAIQLSGAGQKYEVITETIRVRPVRVG